MSGRPHNDSNEADAPAPEAPPPLVKRDAAGRLVPGGPSLNPGGRHKADRELAELLQSYLGVAVQRAVEMLDDADPKVREIGLRFVERHALGKRSLGDVLALRHPDAPKPDASNSAILDSLRAGVAQHAQQYGDRVAAGLATPEEARAASEIARAFAEIAREDRENTKHGPFKGKTTEEVLRVILGSVPEDTLRAELERRSATPTVPDNA